MNKGFFEVNPASLRPAACPRDPAIQRQSELYGSRGQAVGRRLRYLSSDCDWIQSIRVFCLIGLMMLPIQALYAIDQARLQHGAFTFMRYCSGCHALKYMRFSRMTHDLGLSTKQTFHYSLQCSLPKRDAMHWFGQIPPDLSLIARVRRPEWIKAYLTGFYPDKTRPFGVNNTLVPDSSMPDILAPLKEQVKKGEMSQEELDDMLQDIVSFLVYVAEPAGLIRYRVGLYVLIFLLGFVVLFYSLRRHRAA